MKVLFVTTRYPWPPRKGDQMRAAQHLEALGREHRVTLLCPEPPVAAPSPPSGVEVIPYRRRPLGLPWRLLKSLLRGLPLQCALVEEADLHRRLRHLATQTDVVVLQLARLAPHLGDVGAVPVVVDLIDSLALNFDRRAQLDRWWLRPLLRLEARRLARWERRLVGAARGAMVVCPRDREAVLEAALLHGARLEEGRLRVVPVAVPPGEGSSAGERDEPPVVALTGNLGYFPTAEAALWWAGAVWPRLRRRHPAARWVVAGARPSARLRRAVEQAGGEVVADPRDLKALLARSTVALAPMRCGAGQPIKVMEAWAVGVPVVASSWAAAGTSGTPGDDLLVADAADEWVEAVSLLLADEAARGRLIRCGRARLESDYGEEVVRRQVLALIEGAAVGSLPA